MTVITLASAPVFFFAGVLLGASAARAEQARSTPRAEGTLAQVRGNAGRADSLSRVP